LHSIVSLAFVTVTIFKIKGGVDFSEFIIKMMQAFKKKKKKKKREGRKIDD